MGTYWGGGREKNTLVWMQWEHGEQRHKSPHQKGALLHPMNPILMPHLHLSSLSDSTEKDKGGRIKTRGRRQRREGAWEN